MIPLRSSSVPLGRLDRLADNEECVVELLNLIRNWAHAKKHVSSEIDIDQGEGRTQKLKFAARQLNDGIPMHTSGLSDEFSELPTNSEYHQTLVNQSDEFPAPLRQQHHFSTFIRENVLLLTSLQWHKQMNTKVCI